MKELKGTYKVRAYLVSCKLGWGEVWYWAIFQYGTVKARIYKDTKQTQTQEGAVKSTFC